MKTKDEIFKWLEAWLDGLFELDTDDLKLTDKLVDDIGLDSLDLIELIIDGEEEFRLCIPDEKAEGFKTLGDVVEYVHEHQREED